MKKFLKRTAAVFCAVVMLLCSSSFACAVEDDSVLRRPPDVVERHALVTKEAGTIRGSNGYSQDILISAYVTYLYSNVTHRAISIVSIDPPLMTLDGISGENLTIIANGDFTFEPENYENATEVEIRRTVAFSYLWEGISVSVGGDIVGVSWDSGGQVLTTRPMVVGITIDLGDLHAQ